ncbi:hypothetical protein [Roseburia faecis]|uniref:hypothetical protein n=1 Tax=Roseburia faecis TaxID=301302 RepID=UPI003F977EF6
MDGLVVYSVIDCNGVVSDVPTKISFDHDTTEGTVTNQIEPDYNTYVNTAKNEVYVFYYTNLDTKSVPDTSAFSFYETDADFYQSDVITPAAISINNVEITNKIGDRSAVKLTIDSSNYTGNWEDLYLAYDVPENNPIQDNSGNKSEDFRCKVVEPGTQIENATVPDDNYYIYFTIPVSIYFSGEDAWYENGDVYVDGKKIDDKNILTDDDAYVGLNVYIHDDSITTKPQKIEVKCNDGKFYNASNDELGELSITDIAQDENVCITNASYNSENNELQITVSGMDLENNASPYACQFVLKVNDKEYRLRGGIVEWWNQGNDRIYCFNESNLKHLELDGTETMSIKYDSWPNGDTENSWGYLNTASGKPVASTEFVPVTK